jgi:L-cysteate sulfo-lyase
MTDAVSVERIALGSWPTPLQSAANLAVAIGLQPDDLWIKRDDLYGLGAGGNKVRKLEWTCAQVLREGATMVVTSGAAQSNHARATAAAGARLGMPVVLVLSGRRPTGPIGNLALDELFGASIVWADSDGDDLAEKVRDVAAKLERDGHRPGVIGFGGSTALSTNAYDAVAREILAEGLTPDHVVVAVGSGATMAGLIRGFGAPRVLGVHCGAVSNPDKAVKDLLPGLVGEETHLRIRLDQVGRGYQQLHPGALNAMKLAARSEGIVLDPTYTGRAMSGLLAEVGDGHIRPGSRTVFVHTGGLPGIFGHEELLATLNTGPV